MKLMKTLSLAVLIASSSVSFAAPMAATPAAKVVTVGHVKAVNELMVAMQAEKLMKTIAGTSRFATEEQRTAAFAKLERVPPMKIHERLAYPLAQVISAETAKEMARFYTTPHGRKIVYKMYNSAGTFGDPLTAAEKAAEKKDMQSPAYLKASKELAAADNAIRHEAFVLLQAINKAK